jgi:hypothetical protein
LVLFTGNAHRRDGTCPQTLQVDVVSTGRTLAERTGIDTVNGEIDLVDQGTFSAAQAQAQVLIREGAG